jgi:hypothetical protein
MGLERKIAWASLGGPAALGLVMWGIAQTGFIWPPIAVYGAITVGGIGLAVTIAVWCHIGWVWIRGKGCQVGPALLIAVSLAGLAGGIIWAGMTWKAPEQLPAAHDKSPQDQIAFPKEPRPEVSHEQYELLKEVAAFVSGDGQKLDAEFDYGNMVQFNILLWRKEKFPQAGTDKFEKLRPTLGGAYLFNSKYMSVTRGKGGTVFVGPQLTLYYIAQSPKYSAAMAKLEGFSSSILLPENVKIALAGLMETARWNVGDLMFDVLNEKYKENPQYLIWEDNVLSTYNGSIWYAYKNRMKPLKPDADKVVAAIRSFLHIK